MVATPPIPNIPNNLKNLNKRLMANKDAFAVYQYANWPGRTREDIIRFIMYAYYAALNRVKFYDNFNSKRKVSKFHRVYASVSTRNPDNTNMISPSVLWRRLHSLTKTFLLQLAEIIVW
jgi:hypothetical protein